MTRESRDIKIDFIAILGENEMRSVDHLEPRKYKKVRNISLLVETKRDLDSEEKKSAVLLISFSSRESVAEVIGSFHHKP